MVTIRIRDDKVLDEDNNNCSGEEVVDSELLVGKISRTSEFSMVGKGKMAPVGFR